jgi:hypothetical protein
VGKLREWRQLHLWPRTCSAAVSPSLIHDYRCVVGMTAASVVSTARDAGSPEGAIRRRNNGTPKGGMLAFSFSGCDIEEVNQFHLALTVARDCLFIDCM